MFIVQTLENIETSFKPILLESEWRECSSQEPKGGRTIMPLGITFVR